MQEDPLTRGFSVPKSYPLIPVRLHDFTLAIYTLIPHTVDISQATKNDMKKINTSTTEVTAPFNKTKSISIKDIAEDIATRATDWAADIAEVTTPENNINMTKEMAHALHIQALRDAAQYLLDEANERAEDYQLEVTA